MIKKRLKSKTYLLGISTFIVGALEVAQETNAIPLIFEGKTQGIVTLGIALAIFVIREFTNKPISEK